MTLELLRSPRAKLPIIVMACLSLLGCEDRSAPTTGSETSPDTKARATTDSHLFARIPFEATAHNLLVDDIDGDGRQDLALTSHHDSFTQVFLQTAARTFTSGPRISDVGFHPGQLMRLPSEDQRLYLMNAEGANNLRVFAPTSGGELKLVSELGVAAPRSSDVFRWPDWGLGIAVATYGSAEIDLIKNFDPLSGKGAGIARVGFRPAVTSAHRVAAADLNGDGIDEILFTNNISNTALVIRAPAPGAVPSAEQLWRFEAGSRVREVLPADVDQDGDIDLLAPDSTDKRALDRTDINVLINDGAGQFASLTIPFPSRPRTAGGMPGINAIDFQTEQDGHGYLLAAGYESSTLMRFPAGWSGQMPEMRTFKFKSVQAITEALLRDVDGDGWLDIVMSRSASRDSGIILYGPLWSAIDALAADSPALEW